MKADNQAAKLGIAARQVKHCNELYGKRRFEAIFVALVEEPMASDARDSGSTPALQQIMKR